MIKLTHIDLKSPTEHVAQDEHAQIAIVEYGDYRCDECRKLHTILSDVLDDDGLPVKYVFRHLPQTSAEGTQLDRAIAAEAAARQGLFWEMHNALFQHADLQVAAIDQAVKDAGLDERRFELDRNDALIREELARDIEEARAHGISRVPTLFIRGTEYLGAWDVQSIKEAIRPPIAKRVNEIAVEFADWAAASGVVLIVFAALAMIWRNSPLSGGYEALWEIQAGFVAAGQSLVMSLHHWINDLLMAIFFLIVGLELKRELVSGQLADLRRAAFPAAAALGGMIVPASIYAAFNNGTDSASGWGVPMATDIAFTLGVLALLGSRVPTSMKVFATALAIVDDLGAILVLAVAYNHGISWVALGVATLLFFVLVGLNRARVYSFWPYLSVGLLLWIAVHYSGLHATLTGVLVAATIPTQEKAALRPLLAQLSAGVRQARKRTGRGDEQQDEEERTRLADRIRVTQQRIHPPAERLEHALQPWSSYFVLPVFALANAGIAVSPQNISLTSSASLGIVLGLVIGKPIGIWLACWLVHQTGLAQKPEDSSWMHIMGVGLLCGIGFTMSIFMSTEAFAAGQTLESAKFAVMIGSLIAAVLGTFWLRFICPRCNDSNVV